VFNLSVTVIQFERSLERATKLIKQYLQIVYFDPAETEEATQSRSHTLDRTLSIRPLETARSCWPSLLKYGMTHDNTRHSSATVLHDLPEKMDSFVGGENETFTGEQYSTEPQ
jgi:hypothetical protein